MTPTITSIVQWLPVAMTATPIRTPGARAKARARRVRHADASTTLTTSVQPAWKLGSAA